MTVNRPDRRAAGPVLLTLGGIAALAWIYVVRGAGLREDMAGTDMAGGAMMAMQLAWTAGYAASVSGMWVAMMVAMMLPSAVPAAVHVVRDGTRPGTERGTRAALVFAAGYLAVWIGFSAFATLLQWALDSAYLLSGTLAIQGAAASELLLIAAGLYQLSPWKRACLRRCRPVAGNGAVEPKLWGAARQGVRYGASCLGCCAALMALLFVGGTMNVLWMALIAAWVFLEKTFDWGGRIAAVGGFVLIACGGGALAAGLR